jgi:hypothetical protein
MLLSYHVARTEYEYHCGKVQDQLRAARMLRLAKATQRPKKPVITQQPAPRVLKSLVTYLGYVAS